MPSRCTGQHEYRDEPSSDPATVNAMVNSELHTLRDADGHPVCNVSFDLSADQVSAAAGVVEAVRLERHRHETLSTDDVLALRELTGLSDELHSLADHGAHASLLLTLARFTALHDALAEFIATADERGWMRDEDRGRYTIVDALLDPMAELRADALQAVLGATQSPCD
jgi:hypothetical protein